MSNSPALYSPEHLVTLVMDASTAQKVQDALELYVRVSMGQFDEVIALARYGFLKGENGQEISHESIQDAETHLNAFKRSLLGLSPSQSYSMPGRNVSDAAKTVWSVQRALRHRLAWDRRPEGGLAVSHDEPLLEGKGAPVAVTSNVGPGEESLPERYKLVEASPTLFRVVEAPVPPETLPLLISESHSRQTAVTMALNVAGGRKARNWGG